MLKQVIRPANDNGPGFDAEFLRLPELFLRTYQNELLEWAASLQARGPFLTIDLWNPPGATVISAGWQGQVKLRCDLMEHPTTKHRRMVIQPDGEQDAAGVARHCEELPSIMRAHRAAAEVNKGKPRGLAKWVFDGTVPDYFVHRYAFELREWARNFKKIGLKKKIVLREGTLSDLSPEPEQGAVLLGVTLVAKIERLKGDELRLVVSAASEMDERTIANHVQKMEKWKIPARAELVEPPRPGIPLMPDIIGAPKPDPSTA